MRTAAILLCGEQVRVRRKVQRQQEGRHTAAGAADRQSSTIVCMTPTMPPRLVSCQSTHVLIIALKLMQDRGPSAWKYLQNF